jgi:hypothetical protein
MTVVVGGLEIISKELSRFHMSEIYDKTQKIHPNKSQNYTADA